MTQSLKLFMIVLLAGFTMACNNNQKRTNNENTGMHDNDSIAGATTTAQTNPDKDKAVKSVLILSSSPRKDGNSDMLCDRFMTGAKEAGHNVEKFRLDELDFDFLTLDTPNKEDDATTIVQKMIAADVIVMATPVYYYAMSGQMKTMIDRTYVQHREISDKDFYFIIAGADAKPESFQPIVQEFRGFLQALKNPSEKGIIYGTGVWEKGSVGETPAMNEAYEMGKNI